MGILVNKRSVRLFGVLIFISIIVLNVVLLYLTFTGKAYIDVFFFNFLLGNKSFDVINSVIGII